MFLLVEGATAIAVEITGLRFLAPLVGSSLPVWGLAIAVVLAGLAWGYTLGGKLAERKPALPLVFQYTAVGAVAFFWMPAIFNLAHTLRNVYFDHQNLPAMGSALVLAYAALLIPSVVFGIVSPLAVEAEANRRNERAGHVAGRIFTFTTVGSLLGILVPSFITIPFLGSRVTVWLFAGLTLSLCVRELISRPTLLARLLLVAALALVIGLLGIQSSPDIFFAKETAHQYVTVRQRGPSRVLVFDGYSGIQSMITENTYTGQYWDYAASLPALLPSDQNTASMLVLGAAGSTTERQAVRLWQDTKQFLFTSVDIDKELFDIADKYFQAPPRHRVAADARSFVASDTKFYDIILVDTYTRELTVPFHLATKEFFHAVSKRLAPNGIVAVNINTRSPDTLWIQSVARTLQTQLPYVRLAHIPNSCNYLLLSSAAPLPTNISIDHIPEAIHPLLPSLTSTVAPANGGLLLTDDRSPTDMLGLAALLRSQSSASC